MIYCPTDCDTHFGPCSTDAEIDALRDLVASLPARTAGFRPSVDET